MQMVSAALNSENRSKQPKDFQVYAAKVRKLLTDLLHGHETENAKSHPMLVSRPVKKDSLYRDYIRSWFGRRLQCLHP